MFWNKKKTRLELLREAALEHAQDALETAQDVLHHASDTVHDTWEHAPEKIEDIKSGASGTFSQTVSRLSDVVAALSAKAGEAAHGAKEGAQHHLSHAGEVVGERAEDARHALEKKLARKHQQAEQAKNEIVREHAPEVVITDSSQKWVWLGAGVLFGLVLGVLLAPASGRRNRARLRDKVVKGAHKAEDLGEAAARKARDLTNRAEGVAHIVSEKVSAKISGDANGENESVDDVTIAERVRATLGHLPEAKMLERINVESCDGVVTLRGPVVDERTQAALVAATQKISGVREVKSDLLIEDSDEEAFVG